MSDEKISTVSTAAISAASVTSCVLADGRKAEPSVRFSNSTSTGMYSNTSGTIKFSSGGYDVLTMSSTINNTINPLLFTSDGSRTGDSNNVYLYKSGSYICMNNGTEYKLGPTDVSFKAACRLSSGSDITLAGGAPSSLEGASLSVGDRILVNGQAAPAQNGIYTVTTVGSGANGTWARATDANTADKFAKGTVVHVIAGLTYANTVWYLTAAVSTLGTDSISFSQLTPSTTSSTQTLTLGGAVNPTVTSQVTLEKIGNLRVMRLQTVTGTASSAATITLSTLSGDFRPVADQNFVIRGRDNAVDKSCLLVIGTDGVITISNGVTAGTAFTNATSAGYYGTVITWMYN